MAIHHGISHTFLLVFTWAFCSFRASCMKESCSVPASELLCCADTGAGAAAATLDACVGPAGGSSVAGASDGGEDDSLPPATTAYSACKPVHGTI